MRFGIYQLYRWLQPGFRRQRTELFARLFQPKSGTRILDVGGNAFDWLDVTPVESQITMLNLEHLADPKSLPTRLTLEVGDGCNLRHSDQSYDIAYSNSVIEHLTTWENQKKFAAEIRRVGRQVFVQTPNRWFPIEPHYVTLFIHFLPMSVSRKLLPWLSFRGWFRSGDNIDSRKMAAELRLLSFQELKQLFPDCEILREKWLGFTKSFIVVRKAR